eukprot:TRINITY_DN3518_c0_g1_i1.p1 TRINITY_DN3518_c0_g1~~TRINITY_DN3518_c0_g1_i1.p1  ORF type:complete len:656 (+),score=142.03 TRINITY_DN3518_c0_g1_i1:43-2010(+)
MRLLGLFLLFSFLSLSQQDIAGDVLKTMNTTVDPCNDFYTYSCGGWLSNFTLPSDKSHYVRGFGIIEENNDKILASIVNDPSYPSVHSFYLSCMNISRINIQGSQPVQNFLELLDYSKTWSDVAQAIALLHQIQVPALFSLTVDIDPKNPPINIVQLSQSGLALPDRSLYESDKFIEPYKKHITNIFKLSGVDAKVAVQWATTVVGFEKDLASFTVPNNNLTNPFALYNPTNTAGLKQTSPNFDWDTYLITFTGESNYDTLNLITPTYFVGLSKYLATSSVDVVKIYMKWQLLHTVANYLSTPFVNETFDFFSKFLGGIQEQPRRDKTCVSVVDASLGDSLGYFFAQKAFPGHSKQLASSMIQQIEGAMTARLKEVTWMDELTRGRALTKISMIENYIGYPEHLRNVTYVPGEDFFINVMKTSAIVSQQMISKIGKPEDKTLWSMTADTVNAYYDPTRNEMVFPAAILQYPYFEQQYPPSMNFGGAGMIMGHELTHGFDNQGRDYDGSGKLINWWQPQTSKTFDDKVQCVIDQYSKFEVLPGVYIDGKLTQGENVADMGGIKNAHDAYVAAYASEADKPSIVPNLTNRQLLFVTFAQGWCGVATPEYLETQTKTDPHSWARFRVLGPLINFPTFADTFKCPVGSVMNPKERCTVW